jgi:hypothetical protein
LRPFPIFGWTNRNSRPCREVLLIWSTLPKAVFFTPAVRTQKKFVAGRNPVDL